MELYSKYTLNDKEIKDAKNDYLSSIINGEYIKCILNVY